MIDQLILCELCVLGGCSDSSPLPNAYLLKIPLGRQLASAQFAVEPVVLHNVTLPAAIAAAKLDRGRKATRVRHT